ncbi:MAG: MBL fold metallo-hydrolase [Acidimicrobiia bacterium]
MSQTAFTLTIRGVRGSMAVGGVATQRYGGSTICLDVDPGLHRRIVIDCGTGIRSLAGDLPDPGPDGIHFSVFMTHYHWDHLQGLPFFRPLYDARHSFTFYGYPWDGRGVEEVIAGAVAPPWFPVSLGETPSTKSFVELGGDPITVGDVTVTYTRLHHPQGVTAYRLDHGDRSIALATDTEAGDPAADAALRELATGVDVLIHDAQYLPEEQEGQYRGWGHSTWRHAVAAARASGSGRLILMSHDPDRSDAEIDAMVERARREFPSLEAAYEGMEIEL